MIVAVCSDEIDPRAVLAHAEQQWCVRPPKFKAHCPLSQLMALNQFVMAAEQDIKRGYQFVSLLVVSGTYGHATAWNLLHRYAVLPLTLLVFVRFGTKFLKEMPPIERFYDSEFKLRDAPEMQYETFALDTAACELFGLPVGHRQSEREMRTLYKRLALQWHPDKPTGDPQKFIALQEAFKRILPAGTRAP